ncbi:MAG TPA: efflux RND transporter periplasmic adaptor subunit [Thermoanaerobaculia bacterium]|nr:efflux RND transporter periplasmic adaptor subunit [Thermoanaerobaculia bacterium]
MSSRNKYIAVGLVVILAIIGVLVHKVAFAKETTSYRLVTVERGNIQSTVSATGTLQAVTTVSVGTQVSGQVAQLYADFNDHVKKGQLLARIDPTLAQQAVADAQANLQKTEAEALQAQRDAARNHELAASGLVAKSADEQTRSSSEVANAGVKSAEIALAKAKQNLAYTNIYAPIDGVIVQRDVQQGQTVAASLSAPQLFMIANDLSQMQILAQVGESDIAQIKEGQPVQFTVQALPNDAFKGSVKQVRLQSTTQDNVVNYTVVVSADNSRSKLLPGMTARLSFLTKSAENVLSVSNAALRFKPATTAGATTAATATATSRAAAAASQRSRSGRSGTLYYIDANGTMKSAAVQTGITDGATTEVSGAGVEAGMKVIAGIASTTAATGATTTTSATPFQSGQSTGGRRGSF